MRTAGSKTHSKERNESASTGKQNPASASVNLLEVSENRHTPGNSGELSDTYAKIFLVITGHARWEGGGRRYLFGPDTICHIRAGQPYRQEIPANEPVLTYMIRYDPKLLPPAVGVQLSALGILPLELSSVNPQQARIVRTIFQEMLFEQAAHQESWEAILHSRLIDLVVRVLRLARRRVRNDFPIFEPGNDSADRVARYALRLKSQFFRQESMDDAAHAVGLGRRQFTNLFRKVTGQSWLQYVLGLRLKHAAGLLIETDRSVSAVAFESGFEDLSHFHHGFKSIFGCSPLAYREQRRVRLPTQERPFPEPLNDARTLPGFTFRGIKGWFWTPEQYLEEIPVLSDLKMNFLMDCYGSMIKSEGGEPLCNEWWKPMSKSRKASCAQIIRACDENKITFCFALNPQVASPRALDPSRDRDIEAFYQHYAWAQSQGVRWFSICHDVTSWGSGGPTVGGLGHAALVNAIFSRLKAVDRDAQILFCPVACWGDGTNPDHRAYLEALAKEMEPEVYVFWNGDSIVTPRITRIAAESFKSIVRHRLFLWDNYPVNDGNPTLHLGPVNGRDADLCEIIDGYLSNPMSTQNQINRIPLATCADYAYNPGAYDPARSIGQAILRLAKTEPRQQVLKELVEAYPGFIVSGGGSGTNPVRGKLGGIIASQNSPSAAQDFIHRIEDLSDRLTKLFPAQFLATKKTILDDIDWMKQQLIRT